MSDLDAPKTEAAPRSPQPAPPVRQFSFTDFQVNDPSAPLPGDRIDGEYDRTNQALSDTIAWASTSLNSDGSLRPQSVGKSQLQPGIFDHIELGAEARLQPLIAAAETASEIALSAAAEVDAVLAAATAAEMQARGAAGALSSDAADAAASAAEAAQSALEADASATAAADSANHSLGDANLAEDWATVSIEWAEHMPDTIPPNILAISAITGDHWSSRWWANRAGDIAREAGAEAVCDLQHYWMGAYPDPPTVDNCGHPVVAGAMFYNMTEGVAQVYDGTGWHNVTQPVPGIVDEYLFLPGEPTAIFTGGDYYGNPVTIDPVNSEVGVFLNGVRLLKDIDFTVQPNQITMVTGAVDTPNAVSIVAFNEQITPQNPPIATKVNTTLWVFDGIEKSFPLQNSTGGTIAPPSSIDCIVSLNGVIQEGGADYTTRFGFIDFAVPPEADADKWMVVGLPLGGTAALDRISELETALAAALARIAALEAAA